MLRKRNLFLFMLLLATNLWSQSLKITGNIVDETSEPLIGVAVLVKGTTNGTITDFDGTYNLTVNKGDLIYVSYLGYKSIEFSAVDSSPKKLKLEPDNIMLDEFVTIGYGTMKKSDLTGAVSSVKAENLQKTPAAGLDVALQGRAAGVTINTNSGQPGQDATIRIRGIGTVNGSDPIYVVDGIIVSDIKFVSPSDIENVEILKDASATAIYGSRGANGVILVTTKKGSAGQTNISFNTYVGIQNCYNTLDLMGSEEFTKTIIELNNVRSEKQYYQSKGFNQWLKTYRLGKSPYYPTNLDYSEIDTDWQREVFRQNALVQNYSLSFDGGNDKGKFAISANYFNQDGTILGSNYERLTLRSSSSYQIRNWIKVGQNLTFMHSNGRFAMNNDASPGASILSAALAMAPWDPVRYPDGSTNINGNDMSNQLAASSNFKNVTNPLSMVEHTHPENIDERWVGDVYLELTPLKGLLIRSSVSLDLNNQRSKTFKDAYVYSDFDKNDLNYISSSMSRYSTMIVQNIVQYGRTFGDHDFSIMAGQTTEEWNYYNMGGAGAKILNPTESNWYLNQSTENRTTSTDAVDRTRMFSLLGRAHYSYKSRYMATFSVRADASSKFPENLWGYFPSVALAWRASEESFLKDVNNLDFLKIRAGWGEIGNDKIGGGSFTQTINNNGPYYLDYVLGTGNQELATGAAVLTYVNSGGKWETTEQWNVGIDFGVWNGLLSGSVDLFLRDTKDMLLSVKAPAYVGNRFDPTANVGTVRNAGIELSLDHQNKVGKFSYNIGGNISFVKNELTALNGGEAIITDYQRTDVGLPLFSFYGYEYDGIYKTDSEAKEAMWGYEADENPYTAGDAKFIDLNNDGKIDDKDKTYLGNPFPWLTYGLNFGAEYYGFDLQLFFQGVFGNQNYNAVRMRTEDKGLESNLSTAMRDVWSINNPDGSIPNPYGSPNNKAASSRFIEDGTYFRLKNIQLGYTIPRKYTEKAKINRCRVYASANNLFTLTKYTGYDPEVGGGIDYGNYPQPMTVTFGLNLDF